MAQWHPSSLLSDALPLDDWRARFEACYGRPALAAARAPGRVNLIGEHVDYCGGLVLPMAIQCEAVVAAAPSRDGLTRIRSTAFADTVEVDRGALRFPRPTGTFADRLLGVLAAFERGPWARERGSACLPALEILVHSGVPVGGGLSSSAAVEAAMATLAAGLVEDVDRGRRRKPPRDDEALAWLLAECCQWSEHEAAGVPCGIMDMLVALVGRRGHAVLIDCRALRWSVVALPAGAEFLVIDTRTRHDHASGAYAERRRQCEEAAARLGVPSLRDADESMVGRSALSGVLRERALHVTSEGRRVETFVSAMRAGDLAAMGAILLEGHASLRDRFEVSAPELDHVVETAAAQPGVFGARMTGGGFGGCAIALVQEGGSPEVARALGGSFAARFGREPAMFAARASDGAEDK